MAVNLVEDVVVINTRKMKKLILILIFFIPVVLFSQDDEKEFKKRVLENVEVELLSSFYTQDGDNASITGGIGSENLQDVAGNISIAIPLNDDDIFTLNGTISAYTSASSSNLNPFYKQGSSNNDDDDDDDDDKAAARSGASSGQGNSGQTIGTPWSASSGASKQDVWASGTIGYSHSSDSRNTTFDTHLSFSNEFDYTSFGAGAGLSKQFNQKNTEIGLKANIYVDFWRPQYPTEIKTFIKNNGNLNADFFNGVDILDQNGLAIDKQSANAWNPTTSYYINNNGRNTYSASLSFSQILSKNIQISFFSDFVLQKGQLANPMQRVYFADKANFYIGKASDIPNYTNRKNQGVFQLADAYEQLPESRLKIPVGTRLHFYINEYLVFKTYYRYYRDDWSLQSHTIDVELPIKISQKFTLYPNYRYYTQTAAKYFAPYEQHISSEKFYTSDFDLSQYNANQIGIGIKYTDVFTKKKIWKFGLKNMSLDYNYYKRNTGLYANIVSLGAKFIIE